MHLDYCAETLLASSWGWRGGLNGEWHSCTTLLFHLTQTYLLGWLGGSLRVKLHYLVGEVRNDLIAGVLGRFFHGETALPCWWMKTYLLGCSLESVIKILHYLFRYFHGDLLTGLPFSGWLDCSFGLRNQKIVLPLWMNFTHTSLLGCSLGWRQLEWRNYTTFLSEITRRLTWHLAL